MSHMAIVSVDGHVTGSFDQFRDYEDRGERFRELVEGLG